MAAIFKLAGGNNSLWIMKEKDRNSLGISGLQGATKPSVNHSPVGYFYVKE